MDKSWSARVEWPAPDPSDDALMAIAEAVAEHHGAVGSDAAAGIISVQITLSAGTLRQAVDAALTVARNAAGAADLRFIPTRIEVLPEAVFAAEVHNPRVPDLVGYAEIAAMAGVSRQRARELPSLADFPPPVAEPSTGPLRVKSQVEAWLANWSRTPGRRPRATAAKKPAPPPGDGGLDRTAPPGFMPAAAGEADQL